MAKILVVDDELTIVKILSSILKKNKHQVDSAIDGSDAMKLLKSNVYDLMITDVRLPELDGITLLHHAKELQDQLAVIVMTAYAEVDNAVDAMKNGAFDYVTKPFKFDELMLTVERALSYEKALAENKVLKTTLKSKHHFGSMVGDSEQMLEVYRMIKKVAKTNSTILILGESGTGKELVAKAIHKQSPRSEKPFLAVNCSAMPENLLESELFGYKKGAFTGANKDTKGLFESAEGGTVLLDEIGSIPLNMQVKLLRVLQEKEIRRVGDTKNIKIDVRVIASTNEKLEKKIESGEFREDLYFRLSVIPICISPLRERKDDIPKLISYFMYEHEKDNGEKLTISSDVVNSLRNYSWPGNIRQLENLINRFATLCENSTIEYEDIPNKIKNNTAEYKTQKTEIEDSKDKNKNSAANNSASAPLKNYLKDVEKIYIQKIIDRYKGDKEAAANELGISLSTLYRKIEG